MQTFQTFYLSEKIVFNNYEPVFSRLINFLYLFRKIYFF